MRNYGSDPQCLILLLSASGREPLLTAGVTPWH